MVHEGFGLDGKDDNVDYEKVLVFIQENRLHQVGATANKARKKLEAEGKLKNLDGEKNAEKSPDPSADKAKTNKMGSLFKLYSRTIALTKKKDPPKKDEDKKPDESDEKKDDKAKETPTDPNKTVTPLDTSPSAPTKSQNDKNTELDKDKIPLDVSSNPTPAETPTSEPLSTPTKDGTTTDDAAKKAPKMKTFGNIMRFFSKQPPKKEPSIEHEPEVTKNSDTSPTEEKDKELTAKAGPMNTTEEFKPEKEAENKTPEIAKEKTIEKDKIDTVKKPEPEINNEDATNLPKENNEKDKSQLKADEKYPMPEDLEKQEQTKKQKENENLKKAKDEEKMKNQEKPKLLDLAKTSKKTEDLVKTEPTEKNKDNEKIEDSEKNKLPEKDVTAKNTDLLKEPENIAKKEILNDTVTAKEPEMAKELEPNKTKETTKKSEMPTELEKMNDQEESKKQETEVPNDMKPFNESEKNNKTEKSEKSETAPKSEISTKKTDDPGQLKNVQELKKDSKVSPGTEKTKNEEIKEKPDIPKEREIHDNAEISTIAKDPENNNDLVNIPKAEIEKSPESAKVPEKRKDSELDKISKEVKPNENKENSPKEKDSNLNNEASKLASPTKVPKDPENNNDLVNIPKAEKEQSPDSAEVPEKRKDSELDKISKEVKPNENKENTPKEKDSNLNNEASKLASPTKVPVEDKNKNKIIDNEAGNIKDKKLSNLDKKSSSSEPIKPKSLQNSNLSKPLKNIEGSKQSKIDSDKNKAPLPTNKEPLLSSKETKTNKPNAENAMKKPIKSDKTNLPISTKKTVETKTKVDSSLPEKTPSQNSLKPSYEEISTPDINDPKFQEGVNFFSQSIVTTEKDNESPKDELKKVSPQGSVKEEIITPRKKPIKEIVAIKEVNDVLIIQTETVTDENKPSQSEQQKTDTDVDKNKDDNQQTKKSSPENIKRLSPEIIKKPTPKETPFEELEIPIDDNEEDNLKRPNNENKKIMVPGEKKSKLRTGSLSGPIPPEKHSVKSDNKSIKPRERSLSLNKNKENEPFKQKTLTDKRLPSKGKMQNEKNDIKPPNLKNKTNDVESQGRDENWKETNSDTSANEWYETRSDLSDFYQEFDVNNLHQDGIKLGQSKIPVPIKTIPTKSLTCVAIQTDLPDNELSPTPGTPTKKPLYKINPVPQTNKMGTLATKTKSPAVSKHETVSNKPQTSTIKKRPPMKAVINKPIDIGPIGFSNISNLKTDKTMPNLQKKVDPIATGIPRQSRSKLPKKIENRADKRLHKSEQLLQRQLTPDIKRKANLSSDLLDTNHQSPLTPEQKRKANLSADFIDTKLHRTHSPDINKRNTFSTDLFDTKRINYINSITTTPFQPTPLSNQVHRTHMKLPSRIKRPLSVSPTRGIAMEPLKTSSKGSIRRSDDDLRDQNPTKIRDPCKNNVCKTRRCTCLTQSSEDLMDFSNASSILKMTFVPPNKKPGWRI